MISIIGAGPIGCFLAEKLAKAGKKVQILEAKKSFEYIGIPVQCTGLLTRDISGYLSVNELKQKKVIINEINRIEVVAPNGKTIGIPTKEYLVDRKEFDKFLAKKAIKAGVKIIFNRGIKQENLKELQKTSKTIIGAEGPNSVVRGLLNPKLKIKNYIGIQAVIKLKMPLKDSKKYTVFFGSKIAPNFFAWLVPESAAKARIGLAMLKNPKEKFKDFLETVKNKYGSFEIVEKQGGLIPVFNPKLRTSKKIDGTKFFIVGDAAAQVKATTGGGLIAGFSSADELSNMLLGEKKKSNAKKALLLHTTVRKILNNFSDNDFNKLIEKVDNKDIKEILKKETRDNAFKLIVKLILKKPSMLVFAGRLLIK